MARPKATRDNSNIVTFLNGKSYSRLSNKYKAIILSSTDKSNFGNTKGIKVRYVFDALRKVSVLTNENVGKCINEFITETYLSKVINKFSNEDIKYIRNSMLDSDGFVNIQWLKWFSTEFEGLKLLGRASIENYGKACREASMNIEKLIKIPVLDDSVKQYLDNLLANGVEPKLIMDYLKRKR